RICVGECSSDQYGRAVNLGSRDVDILKGAFKDADPVDSVDSYRRAVNKAAESAVADDAGSVNRRVGRKAVKELNGFGPHKKRGIKRIGGDKIQPFKREAAPALDFDTRLTFITVIYPDGRQFVIAFHRQTRAIQEGKTGYIFAGQQYDTIRSAGEGCFSNGFGDMNIRGIVLACLLRTGISLPNENGCALAFFTKRVAHNGQIIGWAAEHGQARAVDVIETGVEIFLCNRTGGCAESV